MSDEEMRKSYEAGRVLFERAWAERIRLDEAEIREQLFEQSWLGAETEDVAILRALGIKL